MLVKRGLYLVGNGDMVRDLKAGLITTAGVDRKRQIRTEVFYPRPAPPADSGGPATGSTTVNVVPWPGSLSTSIRPPCCSTCRS
jgi:hypothetical protein